MKTYGSKKSPLTGRRRTAGHGSTRRADKSTVARVSVPSTVPPPSQPVSESVRRSARNLLEELGGGDPKRGETVLLDVLDSSDHRRAPGLANLLRSEDDDVRLRPFERKVLDAGLTPRVLAEILYDRQKTRAFVQAAMDMPEVIAGIIRRAKDSFKRCSSCQGHGRVLTKDQLKLRLPPDDDAPVCLPCEGVGWTLASGETEAVEWFLELVRLRKAQVVNDFSRKTQNLMNNPNFFIGADGGGSEPSGGGPPSIDAVIRRADRRDVTLPALGPAGSSAPIDVQATDSLMPEEALSTEDEP